MLSEITIENVAVIEKATASFAGGFTVLTGETGAGKSILIDSINAILGNRTSRDIVRSGAQKAKIWATFGDVSEDVTRQLADAGYDCEDELLLYREISADGKSTCRINGAPATAAMLRDICGHLINIHGQHDNQSLLNPARHIAVLDAFARNGAQAKAYYTEYNHYSGLKRELQGLSMDEAEKGRRVELLQFEAQEIEAAELSEGEEEELTERRNVVLHSQRILDALNTAYIALNGGDEDTGAATLLAVAAREIEAAAEYSSDLAGFSVALNEAYYNVNEMASDIQGRLSDFEFDGGSLDAVEERLDLIYRLKQKYGSSISAINAYGEKARTELNGILFSAQRLAELDAEIAASQEKLQGLADALTQSREDAFARLNEEIRDALAFLNMPGITMALRRDTVPFGPSGQDELEFYISTNPGEAPKPLAKIASGGELARIMLALKSALADRDDTPTVIYDEIDTGISGMAAGRIGQLLLGTAKGRQVICVTHTAQVASYAQRHLLIEKRVAEGRTFTDIRELDNDARVDELARIVSGDNITELARANASEMLKMAQSPA